MEMQTLYHVTDATNVESIMTDGLKPRATDNRRLVFFTTTEAEAREIGEIYDTIDQPVVIEAEVRSDKCMPDPEPHGDLDSVAHSGPVPSHDLRVVDK